MDIISSTIKWLLALVNIVNVVVISHHIDGHIDHVHQFQTVRNDALLTQNLKECKFFSKCIYSFGNVIKPGHLRSSLYPIKVTPSLHASVVTTEICASFGVCSLLQKHLPTSLPIRGPSNANYELANPLSTGNCLGRRSTLWICSGNVTLPCMIPFYDVWAHIVRLTTVLLDISDVYSSKNACWTQ